MTEPTPTEKQQVVLDELRKLNAKGVHPTVRVTADNLETRRFRAERFSDDEVRGLLERLEANGLVVQYTEERIVDGKPVRVVVYKLAEGV